MTARFTTNWKLSGANTFRLSSTKLFERFGGNAQNPSREFAKCIIPDEGKCFIQADQAGAEALIVSYLVKHANYRELFLQGIKPHTWMAMHIFKESWKREGHARVDELVTLPIKELKNRDEWHKLAKVIKDSDEENHRYYIGKKSIHSFSYRMRPPTFILDVLKESEGELNLSLRLATEIYQMHQLLFPEIHFEWHRELDETLKKTRTLRNLFGFPRYFGGPFTDKFFREATAFIPQSTVGTITNIAFTKLQKLIESNPKEYSEWDVLNNKHDSVLIQVPIKDKEIAGKTLKSLIEQDLVSPRGEQFKMKSEVSIGFVNWGKKSERNPEGMDEVKT